MRTRLLIVVGVAVVACGGSAVSSGADPDAGDASCFFCGDSGTPDGSKDAVAIDVATMDAATIDAAVDASACDLPPVDVRACQSPNDCTWVGQGCYCGARPALGVNKQYAGPVGQCQAERAANCQLGCPNQEGYVTETSDTIVLEAGAIGVECALDAGSVGQCRTFIQ